MVGGDLMPARRLFPVDSLLEFEESFSRWAQYRSKRYPRTSPCETRNVRRLGTPSPSTGEVEIPFESNPSSTIEMSGETNFSPNSPLRGDFPFCTWSARKAWARRDKNSDPTSFRRMTG